MKKHAPRDASKGLKTKAISIAVDPVTRAKFEIAARLHHQSVADYVVSATNKYLEDAEKKAGKLERIDGVPLTIHQLAEMIASDSPSRQFIRMAFTLHTLLSINELVLYKHIIETKELWLRDPYKHPPLMPDLSEPKTAVLDYELLAIRWPALVREAREKQNDYREHIAGFLALYFPKSNISSRP